MKGKMMKQKEIYASLFMAILCIVVLNGCGGSGYKKADSTTSSMDALKAELLEGKEEIGKTMTALDQVTATANTNPRPAYEKFKKELENTRKQANRVRSRANEMTKQGQAYFKTWEAQYKKVASPEMKQRFEQRKAEMSAKYQKIQEYAQQVKVDYDAFMKNLGDIQVVLGVDLTPKGIASVSDLVAKTKQNAQTTYGHIDVYVSILNQVSAEMSPAIE